MDAGLLHSIADSKRGRLAESEVSFALSASTPHTGAASAAVPDTASAVSRTSQSQPQQQPLAGRPELQPERKEAGTETSIVWSQVGFRCLCCMKPPPLPEHVALASLARHARQQSRKRDHRRREQVGDSGETSGDEVSCTGSGTSESCGSSSEEGSGFKVMSEEHLYVSLFWAMKHWNLPRISREGKPCCLFHRSCHVVKQFSKSTERTACNPLWTAFTDWQCSECHAMQCEAAKFCGLCAHPRDVQEHIGGDEKLGSCAVSL